MKLYVKTKCTFCLGTKERYPYSSCPYCGIEGTTYLEASYKAIKKYILDLPEKEKCELRKILYEDNSS
tara:strand:- start:497 stop:700 length:204 start_codon:yes stop_codon:yes gene_type:complete